MIKTYIEDLLRKKLSSYEFEVFITDMYYIYLSILNKFQRVSDIYVTQESQDGGIDSILFEDFTKSLVLLQISQGSKYKNQLKNFMNNDNIFKYKDLISKEHTNIRRVILTLDKCNINTSELKVIDGKKEMFLTRNEVEIIDEQKLIELTIKSLKYIGVINEDDTINPEKEKQYLSNISIKANFWRIAHNYRRKKSIKLRVNSKYYLNVLDNTWDYLLTKDLKSLISLVDIMVHEQIEFANYVIQNIEENKNGNYKDIELMRIMFTISKISDVKYNHKLIKELVKLILENIDYNLNDFEIKVGCKYISLKDKEKNKVIAYFTYQSTLPDVKKYHFRFYCSMLDIEVPKKYYNRILDSLEGTDINDEWNLRQKCYLIYPNVNFDKKIINELLKVSIEKYKNENKIYA